MRAYGSVVDLMGHGPVDLYYKAYTLDVHRNGPRNVPATPTAHKLRTLLAQGWSPAHLGHLIGLSDSEVRKIAHTDTTTAKVRRAVAQATTTVQPHANNAPGPRTRVPAHGAVRRIQALHRNGWPGNHLAPLIGVAQMSRWTVSAKRLNGCWAQTWLAIDRTYQELWDEPGPSAKTRSRAAAHGWALPLAWDDDQIDDPAATPHTGQQVTRGGPTPRVHVDDVEWLIRTGGTYQSIATRLAVTKAGIYQALHRAGRTRPHPHARPARG